MKLLLTLFLVVNFQNAFAEWKLEVIEGVEVHYYLPKLQAQLSQKKGRAALMVNLHGCSQKPEDLKKDGNWDNTADDYNMIVALPKVPNGGVIAGCWDYYGADHTEVNRHNIAVISVVKALLLKKELNIDPGQVYLSGLSSGGGQTMVLGCMMPEMFAGIGINAGPTTGTTSAEISYPRTSYATMLETCKKLASNKTDFLKTQLTSIIYGKNDYIVNTAFNLHNADVMRTLYGAEIKSSFETKELEGANTEGTGTLWSDGLGPRVSLIMNTTLGHNWPAGQGGNSGNFINKKSINYPAYLAKFFYTNNRRSASVVIPEIVINPIEESESKFLLSGVITSSEVDAKSIDVTIRKIDTRSIVDKVNLKISGNLEFSGNSRKLPDGHYDFDFKVRGAKGKVKFLKRNSWMGAVFGVNAPQLMSTKIQTDKSCLYMEGLALSNGGEKVVAVKAILKDGSVVDAHLSNTLWKLKKCDLKDGEHSLSIYAENESGLKSEAQSFSFKTSYNSATATIQEHMEAKRLNWEDYGRWYLKYGHHSFTLYLMEDQTWNDISPD